MDQNRLETILNRHVFSNEKASIISSISKYPDRFIGVFRSTTPRLKLLQNLLQSREIRFGDALEEIIAEILVEMGFVHLDKNFILQTEDKVSCDHYFSSQDQTIFYLIEQKIRDDHDSTKKRGQVQNFKNKLSHLKLRHNNSMVGIMYFIDPSLVKNRNYYVSELEDLRTELEIPVHLFYNGELFQFFEGHLRTWEHLYRGLKTWREKLPEIIEFNYDLDPLATIEETKTITDGTWLKVISMDVLWESHVIQTLFPTGKFFEILAVDFQGRGQKIIRKTPKITCENLALMIEQRLLQYYQSTDR